MKSVLLATALLTVLAFQPGSRAAENPPATGPVRPETLLAALPQASDAWSIVRSDAETTLGESRQTRATRIFHATAPVPANPSGAASEAPGSGEVRVALSDFAGRIPGDFANFKPGKAGAFESLFIGSSPAIVLTREDQRRVKVLLANRYVVELTFVGLPREKPETWLRALHFEALQNPQPVPAVGGEYVTRFVDELHPEKNRQYKVSLSAPHAAPPVDDAR
jgi:hypothetical protein